MNFLNLLMETKWKTLIILDACRYDIFKEVWMRPEPVHCVETFANNTPQFYEGIPALEDVTLITSNPTVVYHGQEHKFKDVMLLKSFHPEENLESAMKINAERKLIHLIPPHLPPLFEPMEFMWYRVLEHAEGLGPIGAEEIFYRELDKQGISPKSVYIRQVIIGQDAVLQFLPDLEKPLVITSDHGELLGEDGEYGHTGKNHPILRQVPWVVIE